ncbi:hypothetical protein [Streptomyces aureus]|uniref:hypothetical protein n=1 Tax=Streptomyces aureus TaxID=193461 RepID=UPI0036A5A3E9
MLRSRTGRAWLALAAVVMLSGGVSLVAPTAWTAPAAPLPSGCSHTGGTVNCTITAQGETPILVRPGLSVQVKAEGAAGGPGGSGVSVSQGGAGDTVTGTVVVPAGITTLYVGVGVGGGAVGATSTGSPAGAGGGASDVSTCDPTTIGCTLTGAPSTDPRLIVAAGGGGGAAT